MRDATDSIEQIDVEARLIAALERIGGRRSNTRLAVETGISEAMFRAIKTGKAGAGMDTLSALVVWELDSLGVDVETLLAPLPEITRLALIKIVQRGKAMSTRTLAVAA